MLFVGIAESSQSGLSIPVIVGVVVAIVVVAAIIVVVVVVIFIRRRRRLVKTRKLDYFSEYGRFKSFIIKLISPLCNSSLCHTR